ncbi:MAG: hypothetical protein WCS65_11755 [Verrucomicrobiae bacterium]
MRLALATFIVLTPLAGILGARDLAGQIELARDAKDTYAEIELLRRWADGHPGDQEALEKLTALWLGISDWEMAAETLKLVKEPGFVVRSQATILREQAGNLKGGLELLRARAAAAPHDRESRLMFSKYLAAGGLYQEQIATLDSLIKDDKEEDAADLYLDRAAAKLASDDPAGALADFRKAAARAPEGQQVQSRRSSYERLEKSLAEIGKLRSRSPADSMRRGYWWLYGGVPQRALAEARAGISLWPGSAFGNILETRSLVAAGMMDAAKARADRRVEVSAPLETLDTVNGLLYADATLAAKPFDATAGFDRAAWLNFSGQYLLATDAVEALLKSTPASIPALHLAVAINCHRRNLPAATAYTARLTALHAPHDVLADAFTGLATIAFEQSKFALALDFVERSLAAQPTPDAWKLKAASHTRLGQPNEAAEALKNVEKR